MSEATEKEEDLYHVPTIALLANRDGIIPVERLAKIPISILSSKDTPSSLLSDKPTFYFDNNDKEITLEEIIPYSIISAKTNGQRYYCILYSDGSCDLLAFHLIQQLNNSSQQIMLILDCELLPLTSSSVLSLSSTSSLIEKNLLVVFDVITPTTTHRTHGTFVSVREKLNLLRKVLWDGTCKHCHTHCPTLLSTHRQVCSCRDVNGLDCDFGLKLKHPKFQHVVIKRCFTPNEFQVSHYQVLTKSTTASIATFEQNDILAHFYDGMILERACSSQGESHENQGKVKQHPRFNDDFCFKFKRGSFATLDVLIPAQDPHETSTTPVMHGLLMDNGYRTTKYPVILPESFLAERGGGMVVECSFEACTTDDDACWQFVRERPDKLYPNHVKHEKRIESQSAGPSMEMIMVDIQAKISGDEQNVSPSLHELLDRIYFNRRYRFDNDDEPYFDESDELIPSDEVHGNQGNRRDKFHKALNFRDLCWNATAISHHFVESWEERLGHWSNNEIQSTSDPHANQDVHIDDAKCNMQISTSSIQNLCSYELAVKNIVVSCFDNANEGESSVLHMGNSANCQDTHEGGTVSLVSKKIDKKVKAVMIHSTQSIFQDDYSLDDFLVNTRDNVLEDDGYIIIFASMINQDNDKVDQDGNHEPMKQYDGKPVWGDNLTAINSEDIIEHQKDGGLDLAPITGKCFQTFTNNGFTLNKIIPLHQFVHFVPAGYDVRGNAEPIHFIDHMSEHELKLLSFRHCLIWQKNTSLDIGNNDFVVDESDPIRRTTSVFQDLFFAESNQDVIRHIFSFMDLPSHFLLARTQKSILRSYLIGFESPILPSGVISSAITQFGDLGLFYICGSAKTGRFVAKYLNSGALDQLAKRAPCFDGCFYCQCQQTSLNVPKVAATRERKPRSHCCFCIKCMLEAPSQMDELVSGYRSGGNANIDSIDEAHIWSYHCCCAHNNLNNSHYFQNNVKPRFLNVFILKSLFLGGANLLPSPPTNPTISKDWFDRLCPELFSLKNWEDSNKRSLLHEIRQGLDEVFYLPLLAFQYLLPGGMDARFSGENIYSIKLDITKGDYLKTAKARWESIRKEHSTWRERWMVLRTTNIFKRDHGGLSDRSYGDVTDCSPFATTVF